MKDRTLSCRKLTYWPLFSKGCQNTYADSWRGQVNTNQDILGQLRLLGLWCDEDFIHRLYRQVIISRDPQTRNSKTHSCIGWWYFRSCLGQSHHCVGLSQMQPHSVWFKHGRADVASICFSTWPLLDKHSGGGGGGQKSKPQGNYISMWNEELYVLLTVSVISHHF